MFRKPKSPISIPPENITKINIGGLKGRIAHYKYNGASKKHERKFVVISGMHTSHERMLGFVDLLGRYGDVYLVDMPGFGGMNSLHSVGKKISFENMGEYLYTVLKSQKLTSGVTIFAISVGGEFVTRMFQMFPDSQKWVDQLIGFVTFGAAKDFHMSRFYKSLIQLFAAVSGTRLGALLVKLVIINRFSLTVMIWVFSKAKKKMRSADAESQRRNLQMERHLWLNNDRRTHAQVASKMFKRDLRQESSELIDVPLHNILTHDDQYVDAKEVNKTFRDLYKNYYPHYLSLDVHMPSIVGEDQVSEMVDQQMVDAILGPDDVSKVAA